MTAASTVTDGNEVPDGIGRAFMASVTPDARVECSEVLTKCRPTSERRALASLEKIVNVAGNADPGNQVADLGTGCRELNSDSDEDQNEADDSQIEG